MSHSDRSSSDEGPSPIREEEEYPGLALATRTSNAEKSANILFPAISRRSFHEPEEDEAIYDKFTPLRKKLITAIVSFGGLNANIASLLVLTTIPEIAAEYNTTGTMINITNALYMLFMGVSTIFWGPLSQIYGRKWTAIISSGLFFAFSIGNALAPNLASFFVFRILTAFMGTSFLAIGSSCISDVYKPTERGTALGWFLSGTLIGPSMGPFIGGVIVTFQPWRALFWFQAVLGGIATCLTFFLPETSHHKWSEDLQGLGLKDKVAKVWQWANPFRVIALFRYPKILIVGIAASSIIWNMMSLLTPVRYVINPRFNLTTPLESGLFFLAPGAGYIVGVFFGGRWADRTVQVWIKRRGKRVPEDRLRSSFVAMGLIIPISILIYGWAIEKQKGGIPLPVICMFAQGFAQMICFPSLNTYCLDVFRERSSEVIAGNYFIRYAVSAIGSAVCLPAIDGIGIGWFNTVSALFVAVSCAGVCGIVIFGSSTQPEPKKVEA